MALTRCMDCNSTVKPDELECWHCGTRVEGRGRSKLGASISTLLTCMFLSSALVTIASLFVQGMPSFTKCLMVTGGLLIVKTSTKEPAGKKSF